MNKSGFRPDINALRALAVSLVVLFHFKIRGFEGGFIGVDIFFVISGYLMTRIIVTGLIDDSYLYFRFLTMRIVRIWPALIAMISVLLMLGAFLLSPIDYADFTKQSIPALLFFSNIHYNVGAGYFTSGTDERWLLHTWSLSAEWQFYVLYPFALVLTSRAAKRFVVPSAAGQRRWFLIILLTLTVASWTVGIWMTKTNQVGAFFLLPSRVWEMSSGGLVFLLEPLFAKIGPRQQAVGQLTGLAALVAVSIAAADTTGRVIGRVFLQLFQSS